MCPPRSESLPPTGTKTCTKLWSSLQIYEKKRNKLGGLTSDFEIRSAHWKQWLLTPQEWSGSSAVFKYTCHFVSNRRCCKSCAIPFPICTLQHNMMWRVQLEKHLKKPTLHSFITSCHGTLARVASRFFDYAVLNLPLKKTLHFRRSPKKFIQSVLRFKFGRFCGPVQNFTQTSRQAEIRRFQCKSMGLSLSQVLRYIWSNTVSS